MSKQWDPEFAMMLAAPEGYPAHQKGFTRAIAAGASVDEAAVACGLTTGELAGALGVVRRARRSARRAGRLASAAARTTVRSHPGALAARAVKAAGRGLTIATAPLRRRIFRAFFGKLIARRARLLSWRNRRSLQPTAADRIAARSWAARYVRRRGLLGKLVGTALSGDLIGEAATTTIVTASVPVLLELARRALRAAERQGAPRDPRSQPISDDSEGGDPE